MVIYFTLCTGFNHYSPGSKAEWYDQRHHRGKKKSISWQTEQKAGIRQQAGAAAAASLALPFISSRPKGCCQTHAECAFPHAHNESNVTPLHQCHKKPASHLPVNGNMRLWGEASRYKV